MRLVPDQSPDEILELLEKHLLTNVQRRKPRVLRSQAHPVKIDYKSPKCRPRKAYEKGFRHKPVYLFGGGPANRS